MSKYRRTSPFWPFSCAAQAHIRVSVQGGAKQKRVPFSRPGEAGAIAETTSGRRPAPLVAGLLDACPVSDAAQGRTYIGLRRGPAFCRMRRQAQQSLVRHGVRTHLIRRSQKKKERMGEHEQNENGQKSCVIAAFAGNDAFSAADDGVRHGRHRRNQERDRRGDEHVR